MGQYALSGWSSLVAPHVYVAEAFALEDSAVIAISADEVDAVLLREPEAGYQVMKKLAGLISTRLREMKEELIAGPRGLSRGTVSAGGGCYVRLRKPRHTARVLTQPICGPKMSAL